MTYCFMFVSGFPAHEPGCKIFLTDVPYHPSERRLYEIFGSRKRLGRCIAPSLASMKPFLGMRAFDACGNFLSRSLDQPWRSNCSERASTITSRLIGMKWTDCLIATSGQFVGISACRQPIGVLDGQNISPIDNHMTKDSLPRLKVQAD